MVKRALDVIPREGYSRSHLIIGAEEVKRVIKDDSVGIMVAIVLWHCPNLLDLHLRAALVSQHSFHTRTFWEKLLLVCGETLKHWRKLRHVSIRDNHPGQDLREDVSRSHAESIWHCIFPILFSPVLSELTLILPGHVSPRSVTDKRPLTCASLTTLRLLQCRAFSGLTDFLCYTPALKHLDYGLFMGGSKMYFTSGINEALAGVKDSLERFRWIIHDAPQQSVRKLTGACNVRQLSSLTHLCIAPRTIPGPYVSSDTVLARALPRGLQDLFLIGNDNNKQSGEWWVEEVLQSVTDFVEGQNWRRCTPNLQRLYVANLIEDDGLEQECKDKLAAVVEQNGLEYAPGQIWKA